MALCTQADVEFKLQWDITAEPDNTVTALIADAQALIEAYVGRTLESADREETFDGGKAAIFLTFWPVTEIDTVTEDGTTLTVTDDYLWKTNGRVLKVSGGYQKLWNIWKAQTITIGYTGGYLAGEPEHDMALEHLGSICSEMVARAFRFGAANAALPVGAAGAVQSVSLSGSDSVTYATGGGAVGVVGGGVGQFVFLTDDERASLNRYKRLWLGFA